MVNVHAAALLLRIYFAELEEMPHGCQCLPLYPMQTLSEEAVCWLHMAPGPFVTSFLTTVFGATGSG